jgi:hypothetical protein
MRFFFGETPNGHTLFSRRLIVASSLHMLYRERAVRQQAIKRTTR